jgi:hypothetical protein
MIDRLKIGLSIIFGKDIIIYEENTKIIVAMIGGKENILKKGLDFALDKYIQENNEEIRYLGGK